MLLSAFIFIILGLLIKNGKMYNLIAGYNTMSSEKKATYNIEGIATLFRNVLFIIAGMIVIGYALSKYSENSSIQDYFFWTAMAIGIPYLLIRSNSKKFKI